MNTMHLAKLHATGNDFLVRLALDGTADDVDARTVAALCDRHRGIGADGLITVTAGEVSLEVPDEVEAGTEFQATWEKASGDGPGDYVTIVVRGADKGAFNSYFYTTSGASGTRHASSTKPRRPKLHISQTSNRLLRRANAPSTEKTTTPVSTTLRGNRRIQPNVRMPA